MRHEQLRNQIQGSILKEHYLEAFLVQSAYIEGLVRLYADYKYFDAFVYKREEKEKMIEIIAKRINDYNFYHLINFLYQSELLEDEERKVLDRYREKRNKVFHDLLTQIGMEKFEEELKKVCEDGNKIIDSKKFKRIGRLVDFMEKRREERKLEEANKKLQLVTEIPESEPPKIEPEK